jgi:hypothetical protein
MEKTHIFSIQDVFDNSSINNTEQIIIFTSFIKILSLNITR